MGTVTYVGLDRDYNYIEASVQQNQILYRTFTFSEIFTTILVFRFNIKTTLTGAFSVHSYTYIYNMDGKTLCNLPRNIF